MLDNHEALTALGFESEDIVKIATDGGGLQAIHKILFVNEALNNKDPFLDNIPDQDNTDTTNVVLDSLDLAHSFEAENSFLDQEESILNKKP